MALFAVQMEERLVSERFWMFFGLLGWRLLGLRPRLDGLHLVAKAVHWKNKNPDLGGNGV
jgi:hypothetical protein